MPFGARARAVLLRDLVAVGPEAVAVATIAALRRRGRGGVEAFHDGVAAALQFGSAVRGGDGDCGIYEHPDVDARGVQYGSEIVQIHIRSERVDQCKEIEEKRSEIDYIR